MSEPLEITREARLENLPELRAFVADACRQVHADAAVCFALKLAVDEACANIILHGYANMEPGPIRLTFRAEPQQIVVTIDDRTPAFNPALARPPDLQSSLEARKVGGLGWYLIFQMMDQVHYESDAENGNRL